MPISRRFGGNCVDGAIRPMITLPLVCWMKPAMMRSKRGLAAAGGPEQRHELAALHLERDVVDREARSVAVGDAIQRERLGSELGGGGDGHRRA